MPKKPRMPKNVQPPEQEEPADDAVITDDANPVIEVTKDSETKNVAAEPTATLDEEHQPAPRARMRERLLATAKQPRPGKQAKKPTGKLIDEDIWTRSDRAESFENDPEPARQFSGRTVALLAALFVAALIMAQPLQLLLEQQSEITHAQQQLEHEHEREQALETELERWQDPAYVQQQARERFNMVMPGERKYIVIDDEDEHETPEEPGVGTLEEDIELGWADRLWGSVLSSGQG